MIMANTEIKEMNFKFTEKEIRVTVIDDEPYFCAQDVGRALELSNVYRQVRSMCVPGGVHIVHTPTNGGEQEVIYVSEPNLYRLIFESRKEEAVKFQNWVFEEVLPWIRKTGKYSIPENIKRMSIKNKNILTDEWKAHGIEKKHEYIQLTLKEYQSSGFEKNKRKDDLSRGEMLLLSALESMEALKLFNDPADAEGKTKITR